MKYDVNTLDVTGFDDVVTTIEANKLTDAISQVLPAFESRWAYINGVVLNLDRLERIWFTEVAE